MLVVVSSLFQDKLPTGSVCVRTVFQLGWLSASSVDVLQRRLGVLLNHGCPSEPRSVLLSLSEFCCLKKLGQ